MTYSVSDLDTLFTNANEGVAPDAATQLLLASYVGEADAAALDQTLHIAPPADGSVGPDTPENTTDVALAVYQFFTGMAPTLDGLDYLVNNDGGAPLNPNDLDSAYYAGFNQANRYYNFAINLITGNAAVAASFAAAYGAQSFNQVVASAYEAIVGAANVGAAHAQAAVAGIEAQFSYFQQVAAERAPGVNPDLAVKAIAVAYILEEAIKADVGAYASAIDQFNALLAAAPEAVIPGETANGINLLTAFPIVPAGQTFTLTPGVDLITPPNTNNNTVNGDALTFTPGDNINLGATTGNVFNWTDPSTGGGFDTVTPAGTQVSGAQTFNVNSASRGIDVNAFTFTGLTTLNGDLHALTGAVFSAGPGADINLIYTLTGDATGNVEINGGRNINIVENNPSGFNPPMTWVTANTGSVSISQNGEGAASGSTGNVGIADYYSTIIAVNLSGMGDNNVELVGQRGPFPLSHLSITNSEDTTFDFTGSTGPVDVTLSSNSGDIRIEDTSGHPLTLTVTLGAQPGNDQFAFDSISQNQLVLVGSTGSVTADLSRVTGDSFLTPTAADQMSIVAKGLNLISGLTHGDRIVLPIAETTLHAASNLAGVADAAELATGTYNAGTGAFTYGAAGADALLTYDSGGGHFVSVILVGGGSEAAHATLSGSAIAW